MQTVTLWTDGGMYGPNPNSPLYGSFAFNDIKRTIDFGIIGTNNESEFYSLITGLEAVIQEYDDVADIRLLIKIDSELVRCQVYGYWRVKAEHLKPLCNQALKLLSNFCSWRIDHTSREEIIAVLGH
jgi:ribonuclease HI